MTTLPQLLPPEDAPDLDFQFLDRELDRVKSKVFLGNNAAFLAHIMSSMDFLWSIDVPTACTNGLSLWWNPKWFLELPKDTRLTVLVHELWHPGLLHNIRCGSRDPLIWNYAADIVINNPLDDEGYSFEGTSPWLDHQYDGMATEAVYDALIQQGMKAPMSPIWGRVPGDGSIGDGDIIPSDPDTSQQHQIINTVVAAKHSAALSGKKAGNIPGEVEEVLNKFLHPKLPWDQMLYRFFSEKGGTDYSLSRPNRRFESVYLPSLVPDNEGLAHIMYFLDVSGSVCDNEVIRFNSEVKYVKETFNPEKMTLVLFDTKIQKEYVFGEDDPFDELVVVGRGGTSLACVRDHIIKHRPTGVIVFSDLYCAPMDPLPSDLQIPMIWVGVNARRGVTVPHGDLVHIHE